MALPRRKPVVQKEPGVPERPPNIIEATHRFDLEKIKRCIAIDPDSIRSVDQHNNNVMQICVRGGAAIRAPQVMEYFLKETEVDLLHECADGLDSLRLAIELCDEAACQMIEPYWHEQLNKAHPLGPDLTLARPGGMPDREGGPD